MSRRTIVVVGGALGGPAAAARAREVDEQARIVLVERSAHVSYASAGLAYAISGEAVSSDALFREDADFFWDVHRIEVRTRVTAEAIDPAARTVRLTDGPLEYTALIYAAGVEAAAPRPEMKGAANVVGFRTLEDLRVVEAALLGGTRHVVVVGEDPPAIEAADGLVRAGHTVALVAGEAGLLPTFSPEPAALAADALRRAGVSIHSPAALSSARREGDRVVEVLLGDGTRLSTDLVVLAGDLRPQSGLLRRAGAALHEDGSVQIDECGQTTLPHVYACGLCVSVPHAVSGWPVWPLQAAAADKTAQVAGAVAAGGRASLMAVLDTVIVRAGDLAVGRTGLTSAEAAAWAGGEAAAVAVHGSSCERFLSCAQPLSLELIYHRGNGRVLGAEAWGKAGADKRIDVASVAILGGLTVEQMALLDLAYAPPFSTARDALNVAAAEAVAEREGSSRPWTARELADAGDRVTLVDVEPERSAAGGHALPVPLRELRDRLPSLPRDRPLVFVSHTGRRAFLAARIARQLGRPDAGYVSGGWLAGPAAGATRVPHD
jgi:NADPH-dependent 2,4-dienoyl-CoA reductase/sulfur reductase-like enzyme/rhodanese-related sulfurtransferase